ncbi:GNAT family N-acetyltransferase [Parageobacillus thermoglucosidasius]|uniref:GCN5 family acetyltransferase n=1 Tax=Parageobacillus thermoglucosidasius TaxID=1426 RepID=A0AAN0YT72_PARTM|nr:GNAT family N-acetyltransferase [Parageobacillus thermoglucosidasius]ALF10720.1 GCN5 family acetyltransferase [Parageobacillus thermoglucosidasius]ANZ30798.1 GCN5 family acetyltransferase [Parageobacillus thermoglucosidasius]APM81535.1 GNAT family N-acetyltransferase [Parageobacillus thermoglucosidasius]KJX69368.1 GCN5 family acetyltransferase [Parageobacillus thermoglucosidasius]MED4904683.1 GNAT family N-acetyltransferase [Parageobacillus thermoglucosidasius]
MDFYIDRDLSKANWREMKDVYESVGWTKHTEEVIQRVFQASNVIALAFYDGRIVGFGRALSDGVFNAAVYDVVVHRDFQKRGIGKAIVEDLLAQLSHVSCVHLIATTGNEPFYQQTGFKKMKTAMGRYRSCDLAREYLEEEEKR